MFNSNDAIYYSSSTDGWSGPNSGYLDAFSDILGTATSRSHMSHLPLHPPQSARYTSGDPNLNGGDHAYHGGQRHKSSSSEHDSNKGHTRVHHRTSQVHPQTMRSTVYATPRWVSPMTMSRQSTNNQYPNDYCSSSSSMYPSTVTHNYNERTKTYSSGFRSSAQPNHSGLIKTSLSMTTGPNTADLLKAKKKELEVEQQKLHAINMEKEKLRAKHLRCKEVISKLTNEIQVLSASITAPAASSPATVPSSNVPVNVAAPRNVIMFPSLSLKYNLPPSCDILPISTFIPVHGFRGQFKAPPALGDPSLKILLRVCNLDREKSIQTDHINCKFKVTINNSLVHAGKKKPHRGPLDITGCCTAFNNSIEITLVTPAAGALEEPLSKETVVHIVYGYRLETSASITALNSDKYQRSQEETEKLVRSKFSNECGIVDESDLKITKSKLTLPCSGLNCTHLSYFNGDSFLSMCSSRDDWSCPICRLPIGLDELRVDSLIKKIIKESSPETLQISFDRHAKWTESVECKKEIVKELDNSATGVSASKAPIDIITIDDSDDDALTEQPAATKLTPPSSSTVTHVRPLTLKIKKSVSQSNQVSSHDSSNTSCSYDSDSHPSAPSREKQRANPSRKRGRSPESSEEDAEDETDQCASDDSSDNQDTERASSSSDSSSESSQSSSSPPSPQVSKRRPQRKTVQPRSRVRSYR